MSNSLFKGERAIERLLCLTRGFSHYTRFCCNELVAIAVFFLPCHVDSEIKR